MKYIIAGGGTGGHIFPAIAIANAMKQLQPDAEILFVGAKGKMEMEKVPQAGYNIKGLDIAGFQRGSFIKNIGLPLKLIRSLYQVRNIINEFKPDAVIGVGGYSSFPVLSYAQKKGIPTYIHESNSFAGKSNILLGKNATRVFVANEKMDKFFPANKITITGNPVRKSIVDSTITKDEALGFFGLNKNKPVVLVVGGSLGARSINQVIALHLQDIEQLGLQVIWQTGKTTSAEYISSGRMHPNCIWVSDFIADMDKAYAAADIVVSRAGAMAVSEVCVAKKPTIFVPFPFAAEDHQTVNAQYLVDKEAALVVKDNWARTKLFSLIAELAGDKALQEKLSNNIAKYAVTDAAEKIVREIEGSMR